MKHQFNLTIALYLGICAGLMANNIQVSNVSTTGQNTTAGTNNSANYTLVEFDLSWDNSWRTSSGPSNWDAAWVFVKFRVGMTDLTYTNVTLTNGTNTVTLPNVTNLRVGMPVFKSSGGSTVASNTVITAINPSTNVVTLSANVTTTASNNTLVFRRIWEHASLDASAGNHTAPAGSTINVPSDSTGVFIYRNADGTGNVSYQNVQLRWQYGINGVADGAVTQVQVFAIEMVYVPQGSFYLGTGGTESGAFTNGSRSGGPSIPYQITSEGALGIDNAANKLWGTSVSNINENNTIGNVPGDPEATLAAAFPKGFGAFYCMKYEITQGDYRDFLNTLTRTQQDTRTGTTISINTTTVTNRYVMSNTSSISNRNGIRCDATISADQPILFYCDLNGNGIGNETDDGEWIACNFICWRDGCAYMDWAGLRPMTELEYEKACRGPKNPVANEYAWGSTSIHATSYASLANLRLAGELPNSPSTGINGNIAYTTTANVVGIQGPLRVGAFATATATRAQAGATYYGIMEMSGNLWERVVTVGHADGRVFTGVHGNGRLTALGNANQTSWPGMSILTGEVGLGNGSGRRGGSWETLAIEARVSDRSSASLFQNIRDKIGGYRGVRTLP
jgi:formylglycine-generating enzyme required for sulfatase activity